MIVESTITIDQPLLLDPRMFEVCPCRSGAGNPAYMSNFNKKKEINKFDIFHLISYCLSKSYLFPFSALSPLPPPLTRPPLTLAA